MSNDFALPASKVMRRPAKPAVKAAAPTAPEPSTPTMQLPDEVPASAVDAALDVKKEPEWDEHELMAIFDEIIFSGRYVEEVQIKGRLSVTFTTRTAAQIQEIQSKLDKSGFNLIATVEQERSLLNLEASMIGYGDKNMASWKPEEISKFIRGLPAIVIHTVSLALQRFDAKVAAACKEGEENF